MGRIMDDAYEILDYLPVDDIEVNDYVRPLFNSALVTYEKEEYQFSYFALHLIFMSYIYSTVWKIGQFHKEKYEDSLLFARPYNGSDVNFKEINSIFEYSQLPEKDIFEFFSLIGMDNGYIKSTKKLIDYRNDMAHATGTFQISSEEQFSDALRELLSVSSNIQEKMNLTIRAWYKEILTNYAKDGLPEDYSTPSDYIFEVFVKNLSFSKKDFQVCKDYGLNKLKNRKESGLSKKEIEKVVEFHVLVKEQYKNLIGEE